MIEFLGNYIIAAVLLIVVVFVSSGRWLYRRDALRQGDLLSHGGDSLTALIKYLRGQDLTDTDKRVVKSLPKIIVVVIIFFLLVIFMQKVGFAWLGW